MEVLHHPLERNHPIHHDQQQTAPLGCPQQRFGEGEEGATQLQAQAHAPGVGQRVDVLLELGLAAPVQPETRGQQQLAAGKQRPHLEDLGGVDPADLTGLGISAGDARPGGAERRQRKHLCDSYQHICLPVVGQTVSLRPAAA